jgi:hypothetical protein
VVSEGIRRKGKIVREIKLNKYCYSDPPKAREESHK